MHASVDARARRAARDGGAGRGCAGVTGVERGSLLGCRSQEDRVGQWRRRWWRAGERAGRAEEAAAWRGSHVFFLFFTTTVTVIYLR